MHKRSILSDFAQEISTASPDDPYEKRLQIELFQSHFYPAVIRNYFKLSTDKSGKENDQKEAQSLFT